MSAGLHERWNGLCARISAFGKSGEHDMTFEMLTHLYSHPARAYHNLDHIAQVLAAFDEVRGLADDRDLVEFSLWMHDCVYFPERPDNEERSADAASMIAGLLGTPAGFSERVRVCIAATRHSTSPPRGDPALVADVDLTILGGSAAAYDAYRAAIRREFAFASDELYIPGRTAFLQRMIDKPSIYSTALFKRDLEKPARANLERELDDLERGRILA